jgi:predicted AlkP superfamily pyrophosphatase or phosphodiesterase
MRRVLLCLGCAAALLAQPAAKRGVLLISIDGLPPDYVLSADKHKLKIPTLRRILKDGAHAEGVRDVLPAVTYPNHTTLLTGVLPAKHGIVQNVAFDELGRNQDGWYWYAEDIKSPTLWDAAAAAGYVVGSVSWPASVGARSVTFDIPEVWRAFTPDDLKLLHALATPAGLMQSLEPKLGPYNSNLNDAIPADWTRTRYAEAIIREKHARFVTLHLGALDHVEHDSAPYSAEAFAALEEIDKMVEAVERAMRAEDPQAVIAIVSDHGFTRTDHQLVLGKAFADAGLLAPNANRTSLRAATLTSWKAQPWTAAGGAYIMLKDRNDAATRAQVEKLLKDLAASPANGIAAVLDRAEIAKLGGAPDAEWFVDMRPNFEIVNVYDAPMIRETKPRGTHGYSPTHPEMRASFFIAGGGIKAGAALGDIDMRSIAPTLAKLMGVALPSADLKPLF